ncbi:MAG: rubredoxin [Candidatus Thermoplasmatota archaeon]|nr:rubredoxin [Candidatus Thermoplasmatota archaeon]
MKKIIGSQSQYYECPNCGCYLDAKEQNFDVGKTCPNCHHIMDDGWECPYCGYDFGSDFD